MRVVAGVVVRASRNYSTVDIEFGAGSNGIYNAAAERRVEVKAETKIKVRVVLGENRVYQSWNHVARQALAAVAVSRQKVALTAFLAHQYVRTSDVCAACKIETNERNLARTNASDTAYLRFVRQVRRQSSLCLARV